ncbi:YifB family Mg chelatase-like AAA ATPase [bacterium]|nr:YifB family Mg chelatase-like AAA ATPase [bacterium]MBT3729882.1 YifB family Mg chelatase-like AAA ATPase [bacterium]
MSTKNFAKVYSAQTTLLSAQIIDIEVDLSKGLHSFTVVGLPDKAVEESRDRVSAAIKNSDYKSPKVKNQKVVISLAPADIKKEGPVFDLGIALAYLLSCDDIKFDPEDKLFLGELSLDGYLRKINGVLPIVLEAKKQGFEEVFLPYENAEEGALIDGIKIYGVKSLKEVIEHLDEKQTENKLIEQEKKTEAKTTKVDYLIDFGDIKGQERAKRGLEIAAAGGHNIAMYGPPGTGKTMLAKAFCHILPELSFDDALETTSIHSIAGTLNETLMTKPPFRTPHHTASHVAIVGGGTIPKPGEITLAHRGVLFLDEFPEFERRVVEALRQPLEDRVISISRAKGTALFPASFILVAAMNPCPCGNFGSKRRCICSHMALERYKRKISGPIIDRIDMWIEVANISHEKLSEDAGENRESERIKENILKARSVQKERFINTNKRVQTNSEMNSKDLSKLVKLKDDAQKSLNTAARNMDLSPRAYHRVIKLSRTIADLDKSTDVEESHILEALQYRPKQVNE